MSSQSALDKYKLPREAVDVEALAQELSRYLKLTAEDTEFLRSHPGLLQQQDVKSELVQACGDPDAHLGPANAEIERLTPPATLEDRVARLRLAKTALAVFSEYKIGYALHDYPGLQDQVEQRKRQIMDEWHKTEFACLFPPSATSSARATSSSLPSPTGPNPNAPRPVSTAEAAQFLANPGTIIGTRFVCAPPDDCDEVDPESRGAWEVVSFRVHKDEGVVDREYMVLTEELPEDPLPMGEDEVRGMLRYSTFAG